MISMGLCFTMNRQMCFCFSFTDISEISYIKGFLLQMGPMSRSAAVFFFFSFCYYDRMEIVFTFFPYRFFTYSRAEPPPPPHPPTKKNMYPDIFRGQFHLLSLLPQQWGPFFLLVIENHFPSKICFRFFFSKCLWENTCMKRVCLLKPYDDDVSERRMNLCSVVSL